MVVHRFSRVVTAFVAQQQTVGVFNDGKPGTYAMGLVVGTYRGVTQIDHSGSTAGYRAHLARYPDQGVSVAVLCNGSTGAATQSAREVANVLMPGAFAPVTVGTPAPPNPGPRLTPTAAELEALAGTYVSDEAETTLVAAVDNGALVLRRRPDTVIRLLATSARDVFTGSIGTVTFRRDGSGRVVALSVRQDRVWDLRFDRR